MEETVSNVYSTRRELCKYIRSESKWDYHAQGPTGAREESESLKTEAHCICARQSWELFILTRAEFFKLEPSSIIASER